MFSLLNLIHFGLQCQKIPSYMYCTQYRGPNLRVRLRASVLVQFITWYKVLMHHQIPKIMFSWQKSWQCSLCLWRLLSALSPSHSPPPWEVPSLLSWNSLQQDLVMGMQLSNWRNKSAVLSTTDLRASLFFALAHLDHLQIVF